MRLPIKTLTILLAIASSCTPSGKLTQADGKGENSVYYWKTIFCLDSANRSFIERHHIKRVYLRMFDVSKDEYALEVSDGAIPNASVRINESDYYLLKDSLNGMEFIPVVYIELDALKAMSGHENTLASNIVTRVRNMCQYNGLPNVRELQMDCDWTASTEESFFKLCDSVKQNIDSLRLSWHLSSTIRLHQLSRKIPPVDKGVLMVYNTGTFSNPDAANSILDARDVKPYLKHLPAYPLHLDVAYPTYSWQLLFRKRQFIGLLNGMKLSDSTLFTRKSANVYVARRDIPHNNRLIRTGDTVREETSDYEEIAKVKDLIEKSLRGRHHLNILYHLDSKNLSNYTPDEIDNILSSHR